MDDQRFTRDVYYYVCIIFARAALCSWIVSGSEAGDRGFESPPGYLMLVKFIFAVMFVGLKFRI
jgi:hypothetical protein